MFSLRVLPDAVVCFLGRSGGCAASACAGGAPPPRNALPAVRNVENGDTYQFPARYGRFGRNYMSPFSRSHHGLAHFGTNVLSCMIGMRIEKTMNATPPPMATIITGSSSEVSAETRISTCDS